jgi:selenocysteine lyase/cysteine desulfurase
MMAERKQRQPQEFTPSQVAEIQPFLPALLKRAKLLCFPQCSNVVAEVNPVAELTGLAHAEGAVVLAPVPQGRLVLRLRLRRRRGERRHAR